MKEIINSPTKQNKNLKENRLINRNENIFLKNGMNLFILGLIITNNLDKKNNQINLVGSRTNSIKEISSNNNLLKEIFDEEALIDSVLLKKNSDLNSTCGTYYNMKSDEPINLDFNYFLNSTNPLDTSHLITTSNDLVIINEVLFLK